MEIVESYRNKGDDEIIAEVTAGGLGKEGLVGKGVGCKAIIKSKITGVNDKVDLIVKNLWDENADEADKSVIYEVRAIYYDNASKDQADKLNLAVDQFFLK